MSEQIRTDNSAVIERLERERDELAAQVVRLRGAGERLMDTSPDSRAVAYWVEVAEETKTQSLAEIRAEAVEEARDSLVGSLSLFEHPDESDYAHGFERGFDQCSDQFTEFAQQIREGKE